MCGICGTYNYSLWSTKPVEEGLILRMNEVLSHRGPDGEGAYFSKNKKVGLGHRRLAIIDLERGKQPMSSFEGDIWVTYNGEIYNYLELKKSLIEKGYHFRTCSDTEVLLCLYKEYGQGMVGYLNGIFAFVIWDEARQKLFAARDHFGVKPFYYYDNGEAFIFASELKAILLDKRVARKVDPAALNLCLTFRYTPSPYTLIEGVKKLEPGSYITIEAGKLNVKRYFTGMPDIDQNKSEEDWIEILADTYQSAVNRQMISDVPVGVSLSGGVDSGALLAMMSRFSKLPVNSFTVAFELGEANNEIAKAKKLTQIFPTAFTSRVIKQDDYINFFNHYIWYLEEPIGNEAAMAYYFVASLAKGKVKVLLNGQGADEPFAGYPRHLAECYSKFFRFLPPLPQIFRSESLSRMLYSLPQACPAERFYRIYSIITDQEKEHLYNSFFAKEAANRARDYIAEWVTKRAVNGNDLEKMLFIDARVPLPDALLLCEDKMNMACGIEARVPFLDIEVMRLAEQIPGHLKIKGLTQKYIHKLACRKFLPRDFVFQKKIGFTSPMEIWLSRKLGEVLTDLVKRKDSLSSLYLNVDYILSLINLHQRKKADYKRLLFLLLSLEKWYRAFILEEGIVEKPLTLSR